MVARWYTDPHHIRFTDRVPGEYTTSLGIALQYVMIRGITLESYYRYRATRFRRISPPKVKFNYNICLI